MSKTDTPQSKSSSLTSKRSLFAPTAVAMPFTDGSSRDLSMDANVTGVHVCTCACVHVCMCVCVHVVCVRAYVYMLCVRARVRVYVVCA